jgi:hypothetical protein
MTSRRKFIASTLAVTGVNLLSSRMLRAPGRKTLISYVVEAGHPLPVPV